MKSFALFGLILYLGVAVAPLIPAITITSTTSLSNGDTLYVGGTGPGNYSTIQDAIDAANTGDTVFVFNGTYTGEVGYYGVYVDKSINLVGENKYTTIFITKSQI